MGHTMGLKFNESAIEPCSTQLGFEELKILMVGPASRQIFKSVISVSRHVIFGLAEVECYKTKIFFF